MSLRLLPDLDAAVQWLQPRLGAGRLRTDSRQVLAGDVFIAWPGLAHDGRAYVPKALAAGAVACLVEAEGAEAFGFADERVAWLPGLKPLAGPLAASLLGDPSHRVKVLALTGTNGKTSSAWWAALALQALGQPCGVVGTLGIGVPPDLKPTGLTTPDPVALQHALRDFAEGGVLHCAMEASSIGIEEQRLAGTQVAVALFTNFTRDHLDYHGSMDAYWQAKRALFSWPGLQAAVVNVDDPKGAELADDLAHQRAHVGTGPALFTCSSQGAARLQAVEVKLTARGLQFTVREGVHSAPVHSHLIGAYNVDNLLGVIGLLRALGHSLAAAAQAASGVPSVPGRLQRLGTGQGEPEVIIDYAHTPDALEKALAAVRPLAQARAGRLICVFGCGGNRDATKRPLMGGIAARSADAVVLTSDNPRDEDPHAILAQIRAGVGSVPVREIENRREAIALSVLEAAANDVVLIAGKGHEDYQEVAGRKLPFSDVAEGRAALDARAGRVAVPPPGRSEGGTRRSAQHEGSLSHMLTLREAQALIPGSRLVGDGGVAFARVHSDTRSLQPGDLFTALRGERFDAHDFLPQARAAGAVAALAERGLQAAGLSGLEVPDALVGLQTLAAAWRAKFTLPLIAVTGSNGKTTVTQMLASILRAAYGEAGFATQGNFNNHIGLPLTLLRLRAHHRAGVVELGMNHPGEIALLAGLAQPTVALVNNAQREHQEFMATVEAAARENGAVISALPADGAAVFPADDAAHTPLWRALAGASRVWRFTLGDRGAAAEVGGQGVWQPGGWQVRAQTPAGPLQFTLRVAGAHNVRNALAATAAALAAGVPLEAIGRGLAAFEPVKGRSQIKTAVLHGRTVTLVDDSYNANPDSVLAAIGVLAGLPGPRWLVLGDMGEVGNQGPQFHAEVGAAARAAGIEHFWAVGEACRHAAQAYGAGARHFAGYDEARAALAAAPRSGSVLVKGSRFMAMERLVAALQEGVAHAA